LVEVRVGPSRDDDAVVDLVDLNVSTSIVCPVGAKPR
jgi:hypothetical protein